ncbi:metal ABC transporter permease [Corynebacterium lizhenjunii]|uniref:Metal ABC transporter permease n=1 Tax=Corynebacterium lizhenjunii TaxID=2709394 RepID=A0A7T0KG08_9CORY|nr:metal ABC transporter permease [Corynebacterium lizhenjunii]QPK79434.1 metal ABC transporter permease [Corynebacterium lizhenjunii]
MFSSLSLAACACLLAICTAVACALPGTFLVLRGEAMLIDGMGHAVLPGIVLGYLAAGDLHSPWLTVTAATASILVAWATYALQRHLPKDAALGIIFPTLFAIGVVLISTVLTHSPLDVHVVLVGDLNLVALSDPDYIWIMGGVAVLNAVVLGLWLPRLSAAAFNGHAHGVWQWGFLALVALTTTTAFHTAGTMLVIALMVLPPLTARLVSRHVLHMWVWAAFFGAAGALAGFWVAYHLRVASAAGIVLADATIFLTLLILYRWRNRGTTPAGGKGVRQRGNRQTRQLQQA